MQEKIAEEFVRTYYTAMEADRNQMLQFYTDKSIMSFEGEHSVGLKQIADKIESFGFKKVRFYTYTKLKTYALLLQLD